MKQNFQKNKVIIFDYKVNKFCVEIMRFQSKCFQLKNGTKVF